MPNAAVDTTGTSDNRAWNRLPADGNGPVVRVDVRGEGLPVVCLHGLLGKNQHWVPMAELMRTDVRHVLMQMPLMEMPGSLCNVAGVVDVVQDALETHVQEPVVLVGNSLGGHVAMRFALNRPELVRGLVLAGSSGLFEKSYEKDVPHRPSREWVEKKVLELFADPARVPPSTIEDAYQALSKRKRARCVVKHSRSARRDYMADRMPSIEAPTLLLWGKQDIVTPPEVAEDFLSLLPNARLHWLEEAGHAPMLEQPTAFAAAMDEFLQELVDTPGASGCRQEVA